GDEVLDRLRDEDLPRLGLRRHPSPDRDGDPRDLAVQDLALAGVESGPNLQADPFYRLPDRRGAPDRARRPVEAREEAVAGRVELRSPKPRKLLADGGVGALQPLQAASHSAARPAQRR